MKNIERIARHITKTGAQNILVHTIPETNNWIVCYKIENNQWMLQLCNPLGNVTFNLGIVSDEQHIKLWEELLQMEIKKKTSQALMAQNLKQKVHNFLTKHEQKVYKKFIKVSKETPKKKNRIQKKKNKH